MATGPPREDRNHYNDKYEQEPHPRCMLGAKQARRRVKPGAGGTSWGKQIITDGKTLRFSASPLTTFLRSHYIISAVGYRRDGDKAFFFPPDLAVGTVLEMYIHFMVISQREKCTFAAGALAPVPIGLKR